MGCLALTLISEGLELCYVSRTIYLQSTHVLGFPKTKMVEIVPNEIQYYETGIHFK